MLDSEAREPIKNELAGAKLWGWKDPRNSITLPFWRRFLDDVSVVVCVRNPSDCCKSLEERDGFDHKKSSRLWSIHTASAFVNSMGVRRTVVFYEDMMEHWQRELKTLACFIGDPEGKRLRVAMPDLESFVEKGLQHHHTPVPEMLDDDRIDFRAKALHALLGVVYGARHDSRERDDGLVDRLCCAVLRETDWPRGARSSVFGRLPLFLRRLIGRKR